jgi:hypothetical protein
MNSTILRKKKKCSSCQTLQYIFSRGRCQQCAKVEDTQKRMEAFEDEEDNESLKNLIEDADFLFSRLIRIRYADEKGYVHCYTSGVKLHWTKAQCGHFISRSHLGLRWEETNARPQSEHDNCHLSGNLEVYEQKLEAEHPGIVEFLREQARQVCKPTRGEMRELIASLRFKLKIAESKLKKS